MARPLRIAYPGALYHVTARGNERRPIFRDARDREGFLERLACQGSPKLTALSSAKLTAPLA